MSSIAKPYISPQEYLAIERAAETRSEYVNGEMFAMAGGTHAHAKLVSNLAFRLRLQLSDDRCEVLIGDMRVNVSPTGAYVYPDIVVACGDLQFDDNQRDTLLNPTVLFEVLSKSTENWDRGGKFEHYRRIESLTDYVLISQDKYLVELRARQSSNSWLLTQYEEPDDAIRLEAIGCELKLADIYANIELAAIDGKSL